MSPRGQASQNSHSQIKMTCHAPVRPLRSMMTPCTLSAAYRATQIRRNSRLPQQKKCRHTRSHMPCCCAAIRLCGYQTLGGSNVGLLPLSMCTGGLVRDFQNDPTCPCHSIANGAKHAWRATEDVCPWRGALGLSTGCQHQVTGAMAHECHGLSDIPHTDLQ